MRAALCRALRAEPHELSALAWAFAYFFLVLCSYYLLRPVRDALAVEAGTEKLQWLFTGTFAAMLALVPVFGWLCARLPRARLLPVVYAFFALNLLLFSVKLDAALFFIWLSVFNLFVVSVFWSFMSDLFSAAQAARLYGSIAAGGSCGAIAGPLIAASAVMPLGMRGLLFLSATRASSCSGAGRARIRAPATRRRTRRSAARSSLACARRFPRRSFSPS